MAVPPELRSPPTTDQVESGFAVVRKILRMALIYGLAAVALVAVLKPSTAPFAVAIAVLIVMIYVTVTARLRQRFDGANAEIEARGSKPFSPGDFSDEDDWPE